MTDGAPRSEYYDSYSIAETAKGNFAFYTRRGKNKRKNEWDQKWVGYPSLEAAASIPELKQVAMLAMEKRGVPVEELDI